MKLIFAIALIILPLALLGQSELARVIHNDPSKYREISNVHAGAGKMGFTQLIGRNDLASNFLYLHTGTIQAKSGIGHHFHHNIEEMYVLLDGSAQFTINGRTSKIQAPAVVPCKMGDSHAIYNDTDQPVKWLNFAVSKRKAQSDNFDLADNRVDADLDPIPVFASSRLLTEQLQSQRDDYPENGVLSRRVFRHELFSSDWNHVDHVMISPGKSTDDRQNSNLEEVFYVISGEGKLTVNGEEYNVKKDDAFYTGIGEISKITSSDQGLELLVIGVSPSKEKNLKRDQMLGQPTAMVLQMDFVVEKSKSKEFEEMYHSIYVPAMTVQDGYLSSKLLRLFPENLAREIEAESTTYNYQIQISFDTEANRRKWVASDQHQIAWPAASGMAKEFKWRGYDVMGDDVQE